MLEEIVPVLKNFRDRVYRFFPSRRDAAMELVDALSSNRTAGSVVELSLSPLHRRHYCSITRVLDEYLSEKAAEAQQQKLALTHLLSVGRQKLCLRPKYSMRKQTGNHRTQIQHRSLLARKAKSECTSLADSPGVHTG